MSRWVRDRDEYESGEKWFCDWHRAQDDDDAKMINLDGVGFCHLCKQPLYLVEATKQKMRKTAVVAENLAGRANLDMFVFYRDDAAHPDKFLVDHRSAGVNYGWIPTEQAWKILLDIREKCGCR